MDEREQARGARWGAPAVQRRTIMNDQKNTVDILSNSFFPVTGFTTLRGGGGAKGARGPSRARGGRDWLSRSCTPQEGAAAPLWGEGARPASERTSSRGDRG